MITELKGVKYLRDLSIIAKIQEINPIPNYDRVELATVENYPVIVQKGLYRPGDLCVYVFYDTLLPVRKEFESLRIGTNNQWAANVRAVPTSFGFTATKKPCNK